MLSEVARRGLSASSGGAPSGRTVSAGRGAGAPSARSSIHCSHGRQPRREIGDRRVAVARLVCQLHGVRAIRLGRAPDRARQGERGLLARAGVGHVGRADLPGALEHAARVERPPLERAPPRRAPSSDRPGTGGRDRASFRRTPRRRSRRCAPRWPGRARRARARGRAARRSLRRRRPGTTALASLGARRRPRTPRSASPSISVGPGEVHQRRRQIGVSGSRAPAREPTPMRRSRSAARRHWPLRRPRARRGR